MTLKIRLSGEQRSIERLISILEQLAGEDLDFSEPSKGRNPKYAKSKRLQSYGELEGVDLDRLETKLKLYNIIKD